MASAETWATEIAGTLQGAAPDLRVKVVDARPYTLTVTFAAGEEPKDGAEFTGLILAFNDRELQLGGCRYQRHASHPRRRQSDCQAPSGQGVIAFCTDLYDFSLLFRKSSVVDLDQKIDQLPLLWSRKTAIKPAFRDYTAELVYDMQVYRTLFDEIDRGLECEEPATLGMIQDVVVGSEYERFCEFFDRQLAILEDIVKDYAKQEHEHHGFYFRKHVWDLILASEFLARTNLKPRGYAGDSMMMRMIYEDGFRGQTIFSRFMHRHPLRTAAAQAVRNRIVLLVEIIRPLGDQRAASGDGSPLRVMSVACGPASELAEAIRTPEEAARYSFTLLDQDTQALGEARKQIASLERQLDQTLDATIVRDSVRTMLRTADLSEKWGLFHFIYSMGLFDYLTTPVARVVLEKLYSLLLPGGEMVIGNFHVGNTTRVYMEYWMDWVLFYRNEEELLDLAQDLEGAECSMTFDDTNSQMFLRLRKGA